MIRLACVLALVTGCDWLVGVKHWDHAPADAMIDAAADAPDAARGFTCLGRDLVRNICAPDAMFQPVELGGSMMFDTDADPRCLPIAQAQPGLSPLCAVIGSTIVVDGVIIAHGSRPLVLAASDAVMISGTIDVSSTATRLGAGVVANVDGPGCTTVSTPAQPSNGLAAGGGVGGSFNGKGGDGGSSIDHNGMVAQTATAVMGPIVTGLRGGCRGSSGGFDGADAPAVGGAPGGAVLVVAGGPMQIDGYIYAYGAGGAGGAKGMVGDFAGGAGGGSGGLIALDGGTIVFGAASRVVASGGGGGGGGDGTVTGGARGAEVDVANATQGATGGSGGGTAGTGGPGSAVALTGGKGGTATGQGGGGGGGGGAGHVRMTPAPTITSGAIIVPTT